MRNSHEVFVPAGAHDGDCNVRMKPAEMTPVPVKQKVLIVEDNSDVRRLYAIGLNQRGFQVKLAANGAEAFERITSERPDVILLDWVMPLMDGSEMLNKLSSDGAPHVPIIVISGHQPPTDKLLDPRIRRWLTKPVTIEQLVAEIEGRLVLR